MQAHYESAFELVSGSLKIGLTRENIPRFLEVLFPFHPHRMSKHNVQEFLETFGRHGVRSKEVTWPDIRKALGEMKPHEPAGAREAALVGTAFSPESRIVIVWHGLMQMAAVYLLVFVPVRIAFQPWTSMIDGTALSTDLVVDILVFLNVLVFCNTAYRSARGAWVTSRVKIFRRIKISIIVAAVPVDW